MTKETYALEVYEYEINDDESGTVYTGSFSVKKGTKLSDKLLSKNPTLVEEIEHVWIRK